MRLIDADNLKLGLCKECTLYPDNCLKDNCDWNSIYHIKIEPTVDAIPVIFLEHLADLLDSDETGDWTPEAVIRSTIEAWKECNGNKGID